MLADVSNFFGSPLCDTFNIDGCLSLFNQELNSNIPGISIFPNPSAEFLSIECDDEIITVEVFNTLGEKIFIEHTASKNISIDVVKWMKGLYVVKASTISGYSTQLFCKE